VRAVNGQATNGGVVGPASAEAWATPASSYPLGYRSPQARLGPYVPPPLSTNLTGVAVDRNGDRFVADAGAGDPAVFPPKVAEFAPGSNQPSIVPFTHLGEPGGVAVDAAGDVYVTDTTNDCVWEYEPSSGTVSKLPTAGLADPQGIAVDSRGEVYVANTGNNDVLDWQNGFASWVQVAFTGLVSPVGVAVDSNFDVFVSDQSNGGEVLELPKAVGSVQQSLPFGTLTDPAGLAVDTTGDVFVADNGNHRILELADGASGGTTVSTAAFHLNHLTDPTGVAVDASGNLYTVGLDGNGVAELPAGKAAPLSPYLGLYKPGGVTLDTSGNVYVANTADNQIVELPESTGMPGVLTSFVGLAEPMGIAVANGDVVSTQTGASDLELTAALQVAAPLAGLSTGSSAAAFDSYGNLFVTSASQVLELSPGANAPSVVLSVPMATLNGIAVDTAGDLFITDSSGVFERPAGSGTLLTLPFNGLQAPDGVAVDALGDVYVADGNQVWELYPGNTSAPQVPVPISPNQAISPVGVAVDTKGNVFAVAGNALYELPVQTPAPPPTTTTPPTTVVIPPTTTSTALPRPVATTTSTTTTTLPKGPLLTVDAGTVSRYESSIGVPVTCWQIACTGKLQLLERLLTYTRRGHRRVAHAELVVLAVASYSVGANRSTNVKLRLTKAGRRLLAHVHRHPRRLILQSDSRGVVRTSTLLVT
jgi:serine/threonine-protein kinase